LMRRWRVPARPPRNLLLSMSGWFQSWVRAHFIALSLGAGEGITSIFMRPYNFKVWAIPAENMQCEWLGERTTAVDLKGSIRSVLRGKVN
jgi:hypothetical protein